MLSYYDLRKGVQFLLEGQPYEVLDFKQMRKAQDVTVAQTKLRNLFSGKVIERNFHLNDTFEEAELVKLPAKFLYNHRGKFVFCFEDNPGKRFEFSQETLGGTVNFLSPNLPLTAIMFGGHVVNINLPIKINLKVKDAPPGVKGDRSQGGTKAVVLETGVAVQVPLFVETGDTIEMNTETGEYTRRLEKRS